ncbi:MAG: hypothetical protein WA040_19810 [Anaerolineae bacterium]
MAHQSTSKEEWATAAAENAATLRHEINRLKSDYGPSLMSGRDYAGFFAHAKQISELFKALKPLKWEVREELWSDFNQTCDEVRRASDSEQENRRYRSAEVKEVALRLIRVATTSAEVAADRDDVQRARDAFNEAHDWLREHAGELLRNDAKLCWDQFHDGKRTLGFRIEQLQDWAYKEARQAIQEARRALGRDDPFAALKEIKAAQHSCKGLYLRKDQSEEIRSEFTEIWEQAQENIDEYRREQARRHEEYLERQAERERKHQEWVRRQQEHIERWSSKVDRLEQVIRSLEDQISDLEYKRSTARNRDFAENCADWIREKHAKIADIEETIRDLNNRIRDVQHQIH